MDCMITNPIYAGDLVFQRFYVEDTLTGKNLKNNGELPQYITQNHHPAIVSREDWEAAQRIMDNRSNKKGKSMKPHTRQEFFNLFTCSECGAPIIHIRCSSDGSHYWRCRTAEKKYTEVTCDVRGFREESIEHRFMTLLQEI
ncbi:conjugal transfer protein, partial [Butyricicoccus sp. 1XD8-22]